MGQDFFAFVLGLGGVEWPRTLLGTQMWLSRMLASKFGSDTDPTNHLQLTAHRGNLLEGLCGQFGINRVTGKVAANASQRPLAVRFQGEAGIGDGIRREWLNETVKEIVDLQRALFVSKDGGRTLQPNAESALAAGADHLSYFALLGRMAGFAFHHRETIPAEWTTAFIKAGFGYEIVSADLESFDPELYEKRVVYIRDALYASRDGMELTELDLTFEIESIDPQEYSSTKRKRETEELKPGGSQIARCAFFDRNLHSRMLLVPTPARLKRAGV
jgi:hypothetical protein